MTGTGTELSTDVLVLGGGPAGTWAAVAAAEAGARVVLADKGWCGTSGAAAAGGNNLWLLPPDDDAREQSVRAREAEGGYLTDQLWMHRVLDQTWAGVERLKHWGYPFPTDAAGTERRSSLQGPQYMRLMRIQVRRAGVTILDHSPALRLIADRDGVVSGAAGIHRQTDNTSWRVAAGATVLATGGCAFLSGALGCNPDTGDGHLMAAEHGAVLTGMEFSNVYGMAPGFGSQTKGRMYQFARYFSADGTPLDVPDGFAGRAAVARSMLTQQVYARLDLAPASLHAALRWAQPNFFLPYDKLGIDPFTDLFPVRLVLEGTVRGTGGLAIVGSRCETTVSGLFAAGDTATRQLITGGRSGGGSHNGAWAISSGTFAGAAAADFAREHRANRVADDTDVRRLAGLAPAHTPAEVLAEAVSEVQQQVTPLDINLFRTEDRIRSAARRLDDIWHTVVPALGGSLRAREVAAMTAHGRWMYASALARQESRAMHRREDFPAVDPAQARRLLCGGLDDVWVEPERPAHSTTLEVAS